jgi:predicted phage tail protein
MGSKSGGILNIIVGVVLVLADTFIFHTGYLTTIGYGMIVGGVVQMLTPVPKGTKNKSVDNEPSYVFNGAVNTQAQGNPVPLLYGRMIVGSAVISAGINAESYAPASNGIGTGFDNSPGGGPWNPENPYVEFNPA